MRPRPRRIAALAVGALAGALVAPAAPTGAAPAGADAVVAYVVRGVGNGHGRGMSQWGAYGRALAGQSWETILDAYYGGTRMGTRSGDVRVRLLGWDGAGTLGVISRPGKAGWSGGGDQGAEQYRSLYAVETAPGTFSVYGSTAEYGCPGALAVPVPQVELREGDSGPDVNSLQRFLTHFGYEPGGVDNQFGPMTKAAVERFEAAKNLPVNGVWEAADWQVAQQMVDEAGGTIAWTELATGISGPIVFTTSVGESSAAPADVLGLCRGNGAIQHYRGSVELHDTPGGNRVVNEVDVENYLRGVVPKESGASWADHGDGQGINSLRAQAVAARSYGLAHDRSTWNGYHGVARTCDSSSCQVYGGAATRSSAATANSVRVEDPRTDRAIADTRGKVREWSDGSLVVTEFSASNGPQTAGGVFPSVDDADFDDVPGNPYHTWTRVIDADLIASTYGLARADGVRTVPSAAMAAQNFVGIWANEVSLGNGTTVSAWDFRNAFGLRSPGFELIPVRRNTDGTGSFAYVGDSVGVGVAGEATSPLRTLLDGAHATQSWNSRGGRPTGGGSPTWDDGADAAAEVPEGTQLVVVELGYNDDPARLPERIDEVMTVLRSRGVRRVVWPTVSERGSVYDYSATNAAIRAAAARWRELTVIDWYAASASRAADRWFAADGIHLTTTGNAEFAVFLYEHIVGEPLGSPPVGDEPLAVGVLGRAGVPDGETTREAGVAGVALNVTAVDPVGPGFLRVWDCAAGEPDTSSVNYVRAGAIEPNAVLVPFDPESDGTVCVTSLVASDVIVDITGWFGTVPAPSTTVASVPPSTTPDTTPDTTVDTTPDTTVGTTPDTAPDTVPDTAATTVPDADTETDAGTTAAAAVGVLRSAAGRVIDTRRAERLPAGTVLRVPLAGVPGLPDSGVAGAALNVTAVGPSGPGYLRVWDCAAEQPDTSSVNFTTAGAIEPNAVIVPFADVDGAHEVCVLSLVDTDVIVDMAGWFASSVHPAAVRLADTRESSRLGDGGVLQVPVAGMAGVPGDAAGVALNVTAVDPAGPGYLRVWDCAAGEPDTSSVNFTEAGAVEPNAVVVAFDGGGTGTVCVRTLTATDVVVDLAGWFDGALYPATGRLADTRG